MNEILRLKNRWVPALLTGILLIMVCGSPAFARDFVDSNEHWARMDISQLQSTGMLRGYPDGRFYPDEAITRAEFTTLLVAAMGKSNEAAELSVARPAFADIPEDHWANGAIVVAGETGWVQGQGYYFGPEDLITRQEVAVILSRIQEKKASSDVKKTTTFRDVGEIAEWAVEGVEQAVEEGLIDGFSDNTFQPQVNLTRAEAVHLLRNLINSKGQLFNFAGILKEIDGQQVNLMISGKERTFLLADEVQIYNRRNLAETPTELLSARMSFNVNEQGEIIFGELGYADEYLDLSVVQTETRGAEPQMMAVTGQNADENTMTADIQSQLLDLSVPLSEEEFTLSIDVSKEITGIAQLQHESGLTGEGVTIAIIDSGIDPLQQDLQRTLSGNRKIMDWVNFSDEGSVLTNLTAVTDTDPKQLETIKGTITIPGNAYSVSGVYHYGVWQEDWIAYIHDFDFTGNNQPDDEILVLLSDTKESGVYDQVYVDTNNDLNLADEIPLRVFRDNKHNYASFPATTDLPQGFPFVLCDITPDGNGVSFGYDSEGHGTHVAGIAAANGVIRGVAPNVQLMAIKVADCAGVAKMKDTLRAVEYAVRKGADIINISLGYYETNNEIIEAFRERINEMAANTLICTASGNAGPGLATLAAPADAENVLSVGAFVSPEMWEIDYGWTTESEGLWYFNSVGPGLDGNWKPDLLAPGSTLSTYPVWTGQTHYLNEGTSMAVPFVAGGAALLMEDMWKNARGFNSLMIKEALLGAARPIEGFAAVEQGRGALDVFAASQLITQEEGLPRASEIRISTDLFGAGAGIFSRSLIPGRNQIQVQNDGDEEVLIEWNSKEDWLNLEETKTHITRTGQRTLNVGYELPDQPGLYTGLIEGTFQNENKTPIHILNTIVVPETWSRGGEITEYNSLAAGQIKRTFLQVPEGASELDLTLRVLGAGKNMQGRARIHVFNPEGKLYTVTGYAGCAPDGLESEQDVNVKIEDPQPGVWEIVTYSSATLALYDRTKSDYILSGRLRPGDFSLPYVESEFIIGAAHPRETKGKQDIALTILNASDNTPYTGSLQINERLYFVKQGKVNISIDVQRQAIHLNIQKINPGE
ncbi:MAG: S8 family serine peptidase [Bacillota bacterium]|nr:S8 family serine peptidase [Bacillota bacterium]